MRGVLLGLLAAALVAGCSDILPAGPETRLEFACAVLDPEEAERVVVHAWVDEAVDAEALGIDAAHGVLDDELGTLGARDGGASFELRDGPSAPRRGWNATTVREWAEDRPIDLGDEVQLHVLWVESLGDGRSNLLAAPGVVAISAAAIREGAKSMEVAAPHVARAVLLHAVGHALGAVNQGIPVQDLDLREREGPAGHDPDPASVLSAGWDDARRMTWAANATYDAYGEPLRADWLAAVQPGGVCVS